MVENAQNPKTVAVGLSGGIDSAVAASLLQQRGHEVIGLTMQTWDGSVPLEGAGRAGCYGPGEAEDIAAARDVATRLGITHHVVSLAAEYKTEVIEYFRREYLAGRTPNPCVRCNHRVKFGLLLDRARSSGIHFDAFATGHYARVRHDSATGRFLLLRGLDPKKDQSYFLSHLTQAQLGQLIFPLGELRKDEVRQIAVALGWNHLLDKPESQDFIECDDYGVLFKPEEVRPGPIVDAEGNIVGRHAGIVHYTVGQRRGLGIGGSPHPLYVTAVSGQDNSVRIGGREQLYSDRLVARDINWISSASPPTEPVVAMVKVRQAHQAAGAEIVAVMSDGGTRIEAAFHSPQLAITPGQTAVFYDGDVVLGAGTIA